MVESRDLKAPGQVRGGVSPPRGTPNGLEYKPTERPKPGPKTRSRTTSSLLVVKLSVAAKQGDRMKRVFSVPSTANRVVVFA